MIVPLLLALTLSGPDLRAPVISNEYVWNRDGCSGSNRTPRVTWSAPPAHTRSFSLTVVDHDASKPGGWVHWSVSHIPGGARAVGASVPPGAVAGKNDFGTLGWGGPCPPPGPPHRYTFELRALDASGATLAVARMVRPYGR